MTLIADSGSTKTDWALVLPTAVLYCHTQGINPFHQTEEQIRSVLGGELLHHLDAKDVRYVRFYGSGVRPECEAPMEALLRATFPRAIEVEAHSDLLGAARALCGRNEGIASILGTGANSCLYDGRQIVCNTPALGYILGDEGSGAVLGKRLLHDLYGGVLSEEIRCRFESETGLSLPELINRVYRQPLANRFLASLSEFIHRHLDEEPALQTLVRQNFIDFLRLHVAPYGRRDLPVSFVGSIAWYYQAQLREATDACGCQFGTVMKSPLEGLVDYHLA